MCSNFNIIYNDRSVLSDLEIETEVDISGNYLPYQQAPVVVREEKKLIIKPMGFSLVPSWSKESKVKFATHNARIETVLEKPTWKKPFLTQHCIVPITNFFEAAYEGPLAGNMIKFHRPDETMLFAAGIFDIWNKTTYSFSILTTEPTKFILDHGHDRSPIFLNVNLAKQWIDMTQKEGEYLKDFLLENFEKPNLGVTISRPLKAGWEKRK